MNTPPLTESSICNALEQFQGKTCDMYFGVKSGATQTGNNLLIMDGIGICRSWSPVEIRGYEVKCTRSDFLRDTKWMGYLDMCHKFYWVCPTGLIAKDEVDARCGLIHVNPTTRKARTVKAAIYRDIEIKWRMLMYLLMWRTHKAEDDIKSGVTESHRREYTMSHIRMEMDERKRLGRAYAQHVAKVLTERQEDLRKATEEACNRVRVLAKTAAVCEELGISDHELSDIVSRVRHVRYYIPDHRNIKTALTSAELAVDYLKSVVAILDELGRRPAPKKENSNGTGTGQD